MARLGFWSGCPTWILDRGGWGKGGGTGRRYSDAPEGRMGLVQLNQAGRTWTLTVLKRSKEAFKQWLL
jgi:hypothetical protein